MYNKDQLDDLDVKAEQESAADDPNKNGENINILRDRTFNLQLKDLVSRITTNEDRLIDGDEVDIENITEKELLLQFHKLFYKVKNLEESQGFNHSFNPFLLVDGASDLDNGLYSYIRNILKKHSLELYSILTYNNSQKCFVQALQDNYKYTIINPKDILYQRIKRSNSGYILAKSEIGADQFLSKNFSDYLKDDKNSSLYFMDLGRITSHFHKELIASDRRGHITDLLSPIIIIENRNVSYDESDIFKLLIEELSVPLFALRENIVLNLEEKNFDTFEELVSTVENFLILHQYFTGYSAVIIGCTDIIAVKSMFKMRYIYSKLISLIPENSIVLRISNNKIIILSEKEGLNKIYFEMDKFNDIDENIYSIKTISKTDNSNFEDNLRNICL